MRSSVGAGKLPTLLCGERRRGGPIGYPVTTAERPEDAWARSNHEVRKSAVKVALKKVHFASAWSDCHHTIGIVVPNGLAAKLLAFSLERLQNESVVLEWVRVVTALTVPREMLLLPTLPVVLGERSVLAPSPVNFLSDTVNAPDERRGRTSPGQTVTPP